MNAAEEDFADLPPHDTEAEQVVLGGMMLADFAAADVIEQGLAAGDFFRPAHQLVYEAILDLDAEPGTPVSAITVADRMARTGQLAKIGGAAYLHTCIAAVPTAAQAGWYARQVLAKAVERDIITAGRRMVQAGWAPGLDVEDKVEAAYGFLDEAGRRFRPRGRPGMAELVVPALDQIETGGVPGVMTPWGDFNALTGGAKPGQVILIAARPAVGKSVALANWAAHAALDGVPVLYYSLEMGRQEVITRLLAADSGVSINRMRDRTLTDEEWKRLADSAGRMASSPMTLADDSLLSVRQVRADLRTARRKRRPAGLVVIDYIQLMQGHGKYENREREVSGISRALKALAGEEDVPVVAAVQLNRGPEMRSGHRPVLADLRDSGSLEQDADVVVLLYREDSFNPESPRPGEIDLIVAKHRAGATAEITCAFTGWLARIEGMEWTPGQAAGAAPDAPDDPRIPDAY